MIHARKLLKIQGADRFKFLNDLLTISIEPVQPLRYGALLTPQGKILTDCFVFEEGEALVLDLPESRFAQILQKLTIYKLRAQIAFEEDPRKVAQDWGEGDPRGAVGKRIYALAPQTKMTEAEYRSLRVAHLIPEFDVDFQSDEAYPIEWRFPAMGGIDYQKGCYVGQEISARMRHKTALQKTLMPLKLPQNFPINSPIHAEGKIVGKLCSQSENMGMGFLRVKAQNAELSIHDVQVALRV